MTCTELETMEKMNQHLAHLEALSENLHPIIQQSCKKMGLDYRAHLTHHKKPTNNQQSGPHGSSISADISSVLSANQKEANEIGAPIRITRKRLEAHGRVQTPEPQNKQTNKKQRLEIQDHEGNLTQKETDFSTPPAKEISKNAKQTPKSSNLTRRLSIENPKSNPKVNPNPKSLPIKENVVELEQSGKKRKLEKSNSTPQIAVAGTPGTSKTLGTLKTLGTPKTLGTSSTPISTPSSSKKQKKQQTPVLKAFVEALGKDVMEERHLLDFNRIDKQAMVFGATARRAKSASMQPKNTSTG